MLARLFALLFWWGVPALAVACLLIGIWLYALSGMWRLIAIGLALLLFYGVARFQHVRARARPGGADPLIP